ncbi:MAG TPA: glycoside hydrolase family 3 N-terminal domain-containing protein [Saprospiraceae bacterium]|nr:glycoside hydrolase family 3 N-terminal domain-containing protein [Saprospiraceae bacterium]HMP23618.1 glycoside hydrolase family 3 N-terminal domain-containing protein [Saprospiraceae bacterium]
MTKTTMHPVLQQSSRLLYAIFALLLMLSTQKCIPQDSATRGSAAEQRWVDSLYNTMTEDERLGQLFMIRAHSDKGPEHIAQVEKLIRTYHVGSLCFFQGTPEKQVELVNQYQALSKVPLMVAIDGEWGLGMRMRETTISFPRQLTLGAIQNNQLVYDMGVEIARQLRRTGITVNFAPVVDVNNNRQNPVINTRSFGENRENVAAKGFAYMQGMQDNGVLACAKHFPGHGDTDVDSHLDLPVINHSLERLDSIELMPFRVLAQKGVGSMMVAHLHVPTLDRRPNRPTTLSRNTVTTLLQEKIGFAGLVFTDALEMKGVTKHFRSGQVEAEALVAGNDVLVLPEDMEAAVREIRKYMADGRLSKAQVEASVKKVLLAKYRLGLTDYTPLPVDSVREDLNNREAFALKRKLYENALTLVRNDDNLLPFNRLDNKIASLAIGATAKTPFQSQMDAYAKIEHFQSGKEVAGNLFNQLKNKDIVIISLHDMSAFANREYGIAKSARDLIANLNKETKVVLVVFGTPYSLTYFDALDHVLTAYEEDPMAQEAAAQALFGLIPVQGKLPVTASAKSPYGAGIMIEKPVRMGYADPQQMGLNPETLAQIDEIALEAIAAKATPGCVVLVAKDGQIVYEKAFGHHTYSGNQPVQTTDLYDLASITKIAATTLAVMKLYSEGKIDIDKSLGFYVPELRGTNKAHLSIRDVMTHRAGLLSWIPFYKRTVVRSRRGYMPSTSYYRKVKDSRYGIPVTEKLFMRNDYAKTMWKQIYDSRLHPNKTYRYSDLGFYLMAKVVEQVSGLPLDEYVQQELYAPLGLQTATYNPWKEFKPERITPTEEDNYFRNQRVRGYVHDMGAAMLGGVSGHAGLFSNAGDLAVLMQMLLQYGNYGSYQYIDSSTVRIFTRREPMSTRTGIGFDLFKTNPNMKRGMPEQASGRTYGHIGFTGTATWVDPVNNIVYVFLANRTYPSKDNYKINRLGIRSRIMAVVYDAMGDHVKPDEPETEFQATDRIETKPLPESLSSNQLSSPGGNVN